MTCPNCGSSDVAPQQGALAAQPASSGPFTYQCGTCGTLVTIAATPVPASG